MISECNSLAELQDIIQEWGGSFDAIHTSAAFYAACRLAKGRAASQAAVALLPSSAAIWGRLLPTAEARSLATVLWAASRLQYSDTQMWGSTLDAFFGRKLDQANGQELASTLYSMAVIAAANRGTVPGKSKVQVADLVAALVGQMYVLTTNPSLEVDAYAISNVVWACGKLRVPPGDTELNAILQALAKPSVLGGAGSQSLATVLFGLGELHRFCSRWQSPVKDRLWQKLLSDEALEQLASAKSAHELSSAALALARLSSGSHPAISREVAQNAVKALLRGKTVQQVDRWNAQQVGNTMWALANLGLQEQAFLQAAAAATHSWVPMASAATVDQVAWACATLRFQHQGVLKALMKRTQQLVQLGSKGGRFDTAMVSKITWAIAVLNMQQFAEDAKHLAVSLAKQQQGKPLHPAEGGKLWVVHSWLVQQQLLDGQGLSGVLTAEQLQQCEAAAGAGAADRNDE